MTATPPKRPVGRPKKNQMTVTLQDPAGNKIFKSYAEMKQFIADTDATIASMTDHDWMDGKTPTTMLKNPDREPASKGYVKCMARKTRLDVVLDILEHRQYSLMIQSVAFLIMCVASGICYWVAPYTSTAQTFMMVVSIVTGAIVLSRLYKIAGYTDTINHLKRSEPAECIKKYTPPPCGKKEECE